MSDGEKIRRTREEKDEEKDKQKDEQRKKYGVIIRKYHPMRMYIATMLRCGCTPEEMRIMVQENPRKLLGITDMEHTETENSAEQ